jgi:membrane-bound lytic murein transglycosylase B
MTRPRRWARRAVLSVLAGSGLTAAGLGAPLAGGPIVADAATGPTGTTGTTATTESPSPSTTETTPQAPAPETGTTTQPTSTQPTATTPAAPAPTTTTTTTPSSTSTTPAAPSPEATAPSTAAETEAETAPTVVVQRKQATTRGGAKQGTPNGSTTTGTQGETAAEGPQSTPGGPNNVASAPQAVGEEAGTLASLLAGSAASAQALDFYRIPMFLLPVYQAAAIQYDVPWQILAAINEVETDYGSDLSVSTAGAVGWMQFMPSTWLQYGVDATNAGYADPYNPVDAIFAAARYLHAAGASNHLRGAILAYNHSQAYVESVMLRARLIARYPSSVIATLTGLVDGQLPTPGARELATVPSLSTPSSSPAATGASEAGITSTPGGAANATAGAEPTTALPPTQAADAAQAARAASVPGSKAAPSPLLAAKRARAAANAPAKAAQLVDLTGTAGAPVVAVQDGRVVHLGDSHALGRYLVLRDIYGDVFTYAGLGSIAPRYRPSEPRFQQAASASPDAAQSAAVGSGESTSGGGATQSSAATSTSPQSGEPERDPAPTQPASAGRQLPLTLNVKAHAGRSAASAANAEAQEQAEAAQAQAISTGAGKVRMYAHPGNPVARVAAARAAKRKTSDGGWVPLRSGSVVSQGTVLGHLSTLPGTGTGQLRFAVRPAGDTGTIDPRALLSNWKQLGAALRPKGSKGRHSLLGATADDVFPMSKSELELAVLSDPGVELSTCDRQDIASGAVDDRVLAVLEFLSRSGLQPTVSGLRCVSGSGHQNGDAVDISAINGIKIAGHQGARTITDTTIRALLTLRGRFAPHRIVSLMHYPQAPSTLALSREWDHIHIEFQPLRPRAHAASAKVKPAAGGGLSQLQWSQLVARIGALPQPTVASKPSSAAIRDH